MPWSMRIWPRWRFACGLVGEFRAAALRFSAAKLGRPCLGRRGVEARAARARERQGALVVLERLAAAVQVVEGDGHVVGVIGVVGLCAVGLEVLLVRLGPAILLRELVAQREVERWRVALRGKQRLDAAL